MPPGRHEMIEPVKSRAAGALHEVPTSPCPRSHSVHADRRRIRRLEDPVVLHRCAYRARQLVRVERLLSHGDDDGIYMMGDRVTE